MKKILFAAPHLFSGFITVGAQHYALEFSNCNWDVAYISNSLSPFNVLFTKDQKNILARLNNFKRSGINIKSNLWSYVPFTFIPHHNETIFDKKWFLNNYHKFTFPPVKYLVKKRGFNKVDVLWIDCANQNFWKNILEFKCSIYRVSDDIVSTSNTRSIVLDAHEKAIVSSDLVLVTSKILLNNLNQKYKNIHFVYCPNGVDLSHFMRDKYEEPKEYENVRGEKALYIGAIEDWFDTELLKYLAHKCSDINIFIIGPDRLGQVRNSLGKNIFYLGSKEYKQIPNYIYHCDYGIIPFRVTKLTQCINPIKMYEFFSLGKPVLSIRLEELELLKSPCLLAKNYQEFVDIIRCKEKLYCYESSYLKNYAKQNTWEKRYLLIGAILKSYGI